MPRVSIGLPVYNGERYLAEALESLLTQRFEDFELIISDNASTDGTGSIGRDYARKDARITYVRNRVNVGVAGNFNQTFRLSSGEFFKWAAHDDVCGPDLLGACVEALDRDPGAVLAYPRVAMIDERGRIIRRNGPGPDMTSQDPADRLSTLMRNPFWATSIFSVMRSRILADTGLMGNNAACDHILLAELSLRGRFVELPRYDFFNRDHPGRTLAKSSIIQRAIYVDPTLPRVAGLLRLMQLGGYVRAIHRAPVGRGIRRRGYFAVGRWLTARVASRTLAHGRALPEPHQPVDSRGAA
jgi:glycosyltransferase involved in cell wall biosynthesis